MHDDDDDYIPESERIAQLQSEIAVLRSRMDALEKEIENIRAMDLHTKVAVLSAQMDALQANRKSVSRQLDFLTVVCVGTGMIATTTLTVAIRIFYAQP